MKKPYLKKWGKRGKYIIWVVDGEWIRSNKDIGFTNFGIHAQRSYIPTDEIWLDKEYNPNESEIFVTRLVAQQEALSFGNSYNKAWNIGDKVEKKVRSSKRFKGRVKIKRLPEFDRSGFRVWVVDGKLVRSRHNVNFTEGGNGYIYKFIKDKREIWVDNDVVPGERLYIVDHEVHEALKMRSRIGYNEAHTGSNISESKMRRKVRR